MIARGEITQKKENTSLLFGLVVGQREENNNPHGLLRAA
jgi:hypothetical protein